MTNSTNLDVIIIGGSYAGLSSAMALGRALRSVLIIDSGIPCNRKTVHAHNFLTQDGEKPDLISQKAKEQVLKYDTVKIVNDLAVGGKKTKEGFEITTQSGHVFSAKKLIFASGVKDIMPALNGFSECWGISILHCPYCHGYEAKGETTGILANGDFASHYAQIVRNLTQDLTIFTNGKASFTEEQIIKFQAHNIPVVEKEIATLKNDNGKLQKIIFKDNTAFDLTTIYARPDYEQHCKIPEALGCELTEFGLIKVDLFQMTTIAGISACGDNASLMRSISLAVASGNIAGSMLNNTMTTTEF